MGNGSKTAKREWKRKGMRGQSLKQWGRSLKNDYRSDFPAPKPAIDWAMRKGLV